MCKPNVQYFQHKNVPFFLIVPVVGLIYVFWHIWCVLPLPAVWRCIVTAAGVLCFVMMFPVMARVNDRLPLWCTTLMYEISTSFLFVALYLFIAFLILDILRLTGIVSKSLLYSNGITCIVLFLLTAGVFACGNTRYNNKERREITLHTTKKINKPRRIVMMSDLHLGYNNRRAEFARWVDIVNAEQPDLILIAGDIIDMSMRPLVDEDVAAEFRRLNAPVYACFGNHEYYAGVDDAEHFYRSAGINLLRDDVAELDGLCLIGRDDATNRRRKPLKELTAQADSGSYTILLDHRPLNLRQAELAGIDFQFSGHTHHGQVFPISLITEAIYEVAYGSHQRGETLYYVTSGMGIWGGKYRIGTCSEYVVATLVSGEECI